MLGLGQCCVLRQVQQQICTICQHDMNDHDPACPLAVAKLLEKSAKNIHAQCPNCHEKKLGINLDDWYECRNCNAQFASGHGIPFDAEKLERANLLVDSWVRHCNSKIEFTIHTECVSVVCLPEKGRGIFPYDESMSFCDYVAKLARAKMRRNKNVDLDLSALWVEAYESLSPRKEVKNVLKSTQEIPQQKIQEILKSALEI